MKLGRGTKLTLLFVTTFSCVKIAGGVWMEYEIAGFDNMDGSLLKTDLKSKRYDKTSFGISGTVHIVNDFCDDFEIELVLFHSAKGNNQFVKMPYKVPKDDLCTTVNGIYIKSKCARDVAAASDLPAPVENESLCALYKAGNYTIKQYILGKDVVPKFLQTGLYKAQILVNKKGSDEVSTFTLHVKLY
ncbi:uncharacterized protein LOC119068086 [Bradysia coprophila]|uniref:uncharacterized protein LOC119068086 n=1 Tax=Bradysia coprophila TaxID=38358 RepID=UPI00187DC0B0|nr:uncharacterized protein LOC119068086 [Bradysia coprophila]